MQKSFRFTASTTLHYYPFGMLQPNRQYTATSAANYRFGFNGKENDNEIYGEGNSYDYNAIIYDPRLLRFMSVDPLFKDYASLSTYSYCADNPILFRDNNGRKIFIYYQDENGKSVTYEYGSAQKIPDNDFVHQTIAAIDKDKISAQSTGEIINSLATSLIKNANIVQTSEDAFHSEEIPDVQDAKGNNIPIGSTVDPATAVINSVTVPFNPTAALSNGKGESTSPATDLAHELGHGWYDLFMTEESLTASQTYDAQFGNKNERFVIETFEHPTASYSGEWQRQDHSTGIPIMTEDATSNREISTPSDIGQGTPINLIKK